MLKAQNRSITQKQHTVNCTFCSVHYLFCMYSVQYLCTLCSSVEEYRGSLCLANLSSLLRQSWLWGTAKEKYESLTSATSEEKGLDSISTFLRRAATSYHAAIWWFWYCRFRYEINMAWKKREGPCQDSRSRRRSDRTLKEKQWGEKKKKKKAKTRLDETK